MFRTGGSFHRWWASCASGLGRAAIGSGRFLEFQSDEPRHFGKKIGRFVNGVTGVLGDVCVFLCMAGTTQHDRPQKFGSFGIFKMIKSQW